MILSVITANKDINKFEVYQLLTLICIAIIFKTLVLTVNNKAERGFGLLVGAAKPSET